MITIKETTRKINTIAKHSKDLVTLLDEVMPPVLFHAMKDGQITPAVELVGKVSAKHRPSVVEYLCEFGPFAYSKTKGFHYDKAKVKPYAGEQGTDIRETFVLIEIDTFPLYSEFNGKADQVIETAPFDFDAKLIELLHRAKLAQSGNSTKFNGLVDSKYLQMIRNNLPGEVLIKVDTIKDNGKTKDLVPAIEAEQVAIAA